MSEITMTNLAQRLDISRPKLSKIENGHALPTPSLVKSISNVLGLSPAEERSLLNQLDILISPTVDQLSVPRISWKPEMWSFLFSKATCIRVNTFISMPALLQSVAYVDAMRVPVDGDVARLHKSRMQCQSLLWDADKTFVIVLRESVLQQMPLSFLDAMGQLLHILNIASSANIELKVIPKSTAIPQSICSDFTIFDNESVLVDLPDESFHKSARQDLERYRQIFNEASQLALDHESSKALIERLVSKNWTVLSEFGVAWV